jgi:hypothetical protein
MSNKLKSDIKKIGNLLNSFNKCVDSKCKNIASRKELFEMQTNNYMKLKKECETKSKNKTKVFKCVSKGQRKYLKSDPEFIKKTKSLDKCATTKCRSVKNKINNILSKTVK